jgi:hypothetical protein
MIKQAASDYRVLAEPSQGHVAAAGRDHYQGLAHAARERVRRLLKV